MAEEIDYMQLVTSSDSFKKLDKDLQAKILAAEGDEKKYFLQIFLEEKEGVAKAKSNFAENIGQAIKGFDTGVKKAQKEFMKTAEVEIQKVDVNNAENLINSLK